MNLGQPKPVILSLNDVYEKDVTDEKIHHQFHLQIHLGIGPKTCPKTRRNHLFDWILKSTFTCQTVFKPLEQRPTAIVSDHITVHIYRRVANNHSVNTVAKLIPLKISIYRMCSLCVSSLIPILAICHHCRCFADEASLRRGAVGYAPLTLISIKLFRSNLAMNTAILINISASRCRTLARCPIVEGEIGRITPWAWRRAGTFQSDPVVVAGWLIGSQAIHNAIIECIVNRRKVTTLRLAEGLSRVPASEYSSLKKYAEVVKNLKKLVLNAVWNARFLFDSIRLKIDRPALKLSKWAMLCLNRIESKQMCTPNWMRNNCDNELLDKSEKSAN